MKKTILSAALILMLSAGIFAQHCPYDGYFMIVVHLTDENNKPVENAALTLQEIDNPQAESCAFFKGLINKSFSPVKTQLSSVFGEELPRGSAVKRFCEDCGFLGEGFYAVVLESAEAACKIYEPDNNINSQKRNFEIRYGEQILPIDQTAIYRLCWSQGKWSRIKPVELQTKLKRTTK